MTATAPTTTGAVDEGSPRVLRGVAVQFNQPTVVADIVAGKVVVCTETFDQLSFTTLPAKVPLRLSHNRAQPTGWAVPRVERDGVHFEARLAGGPAHIAHAVELIREELLSGISIGFVASADDVWRKGPTADSLPHVTRRNAELHEISLVDQPAYASARVSSCTPPHRGENRE